MNPARPTLVDAVAAHARYAPGSPAVVDGTGELSYGELWAACAAVARGLARAGVRPGERVVVAATPGGAYLTVLFGAMAAGAVVVPLNTRLTAAEAGAFLAGLEPRLAVCDAAHAALAATLGLPVVDLADLVGQVHHRQPERRRQPRVGGVADREARFQAGEERAGLRRGQPGVERHDHGPRGHRAEQHGEVRPARCRGHHHPLPRADTRAAQPPRHRRARRPQLAVRQLAGAVHDGGRAGRVPGVGGDRVDQRGPGRVHERAPRPRPCRATMPSITSDVPPAIVSITVSCHRNAWMPSRAEAATSPRS